MFIAEKFKPVKFVLQNIFKFFYPSFCRECNKLIPQGAVFCTECDQKIVPIVSRYLPITPKKSFQVFAISNYQNPIRPLILKKSYSDIFSSRQLGLLILQKIPINDWEIDYIIPIPLHWTRYSKRGYNQACEIAKIVGKRLNIPVAKVLRRHRKTEFQSKLSFEERQKNVNGVFCTSWRYWHKGLNFLENKNILLVDDLCTTGATLKNAARILVDFKPKSIRAVVACRVV